ncbi:flagellin lysine-N-methylase [Paenibacillus methanolicus]|uniref:Lysine-N-methylase n=1 Tax=Paenibacillus methanolicus TaxID=582686 RepID=A0A5S5C5S3_9BACL|nr:flagellin lysine-N-methylase [Paenibacillus methanolicus]TYP74529.1 lysine-N-methylase [Paenibacillus methanolicus]
MSKRIVHSLNYMADFHCIGPACEDTCCAGWRIDIDRATYGRYEQLLHPELDGLGGQIEPNPDSDRDENFGRMVMQADQRCPQLRSDNLCRIQAAVGEGYLSDVCSAFPRITNKVEGQLERSASLSCPAAARLILLNEQGIRFVVMEEEAEQRHILARQWPPADRPSGDPYWKQVRALLIDILQTRTLRIEDRLLKGAELLHAVQTWDKSEEPDTISARLTAIAGELAQGTIPSRDGAARPSLPERIRLLRKLLEARMVMGIPNRRYVQCLTEVFGGLAYTSSELTDDSLTRYMNGYDRYYAPFMREHGYLLENYAVNGCYQLLLPHLHKRDPLIGWLHLTAQFALVEFQLVGMAARLEARFGLDDVVRLIQSFSKTMEHAPLYQKRMIGMLKETGVPPLALIEQLVAPTGLERPTADESEPPLMAM